MIDAFRSPTLSIVAALVFVLAIPCYLASFRAFANVRARSMPAVEKEIPLFLARLGLFGSVSIGTISLELAFYSLTGSRVVEAALGIMVGGAISFFGLRDSYALLPAPNAYEIASARVSIAVAVLLPLMFVAFGLQTLWALAHVARYAWSEGIGNAMFAIEIFVFQINIVNAYFTCRRLARRVAVVPS